MRFLSGLVVAALGLGAAANPIRGQQSNYDYIVVGGGPSGIITAERLAEAGKKVLLLERGYGPTVGTGSNHTLSWDSSLTPFDVPILSQAASKLASETYHCDDTAETAACVLGGGCTINPMMFVRPAAHDFNDKWPRGWQWNDVAAAAARLYARNPGTEVPSADGTYYDTGLYNVLSTFFQRLGWTSTDMLKQPDAKYQSYSYPSWNIQNGLRAGPLYTYLPLARRYNNFSFRLHSKVTRLVRSTRRSSRVLAIEVEDTETGITETLRLSCGGRVILAAGSMSTPKLLFGAGIGPSDQIAIANESGVAVPPQSAWINLPVGQHLQDHALFSFNVDTSSWAGSKYSYNTAPVNAAVIANGSATADIALYEQSNPGRSGPLTQSRHRLIFYTLQKGSDGNTRYFQGSCAGSGKNAVNIKLYLTHGLSSTGVLKLKADGSTYFATSPYLQTTADQEAVATFIDTLLADIKGPASNSTFTVAKNTSAIVATLDSAHHISGTAKLGTDDGRTGGTSVVDTNAKVYGTDNLFVVDASIHPDVPTGNNQAYTMVVAEAAVAKILAYSK